MTVTINVLMAYSKRLYLTKVVPFQYPEPMGLTYVPYLSSLPLKKNGDPYHWDVLYDKSGDADGQTPGYYQRCLVAVYAEDSDHAILEADPEILRIDNI